MLFDEVWRNIQSLSGSPFQLARKKAFTCKAHEGFLAPSTTNRNLPRSDFARAFAARPLKNVRQVKELGVRGPSYVFAILNDGRVPLPRQLPQAEPQTLDRAAGDSIEQRLAEEFLVAELARELGVTLTKRRLTFAAGDCVEVDGACESPPILCEAWAHQGPPKAAQKFKVMTDAFKLVYASQHFSPNTRKILVLSDPAAAAHFLGRSWMAQALKSSGVEVRPIALPESLRNTVLAAQKRQYR